MDSIVHNAHTAMKFKSCEGIIHIDTSDHLHEDCQKEAHIHRQVKQVPNKFQVKREDRFLFPLPLHKHVTDIENIFYKNGYCCCC